MICKTCEKPVCGAIETGHSVCEYSKEDKDARPDLCHGHKPQNGDGEEETSDRSLARRIYQKVWPSGWGLKMHEEFEKKYGWFITPTGNNATHVWNFFSNDLCHRQVRLEEEIEKALTSHRQSSDERIGRLREAMIKVTGEGLMQRKGIPVAYLDGVNDCLAAFDQALTQEGEGK